MTATKDKFFKPEKVNARDKAATTDHTARAIIEAEANARDNKTEKLKALRLQREAEGGETAAATPKKAKRAPSK